MQAVSRSKCKKQDYAHRIFSFNASRLLVCSLVMRPGDALARTVMICTFRCDRMRRREDRDTSLTAPPPVFGCEIAPLDRGFGGRLYRNMMAAMKRDNPDSRTPILLALDDNAAILARLHEEDANGIPGVAPSRRERRIGGLLHLVGFGARLLALFQHAVGHHGARRRQRRPSRE